MSSSSLLKWLLLAFLAPSSPSWSQAPAENPVRTFVEPDVPSVTLPLPPSRLPSTIVTPAAPRLAVQPPEVRFGFEPSWSISDKIFENTNISANILQAPAKAQRELDKALDACRKAQWEKAEIHLHNALQHYPLFSAAHYNLGVVAVRKGELAKGEALVARALDLDPHNLYSLFALAVLRLADNDPATSLRYAERFVALAPQEPHGLVMLAVIQTFNRNLDAALLTFERVEKREHRDIAAYHLLAGSIHELRGDAHRALVEYQKYLREAPKAANAAKVRAAVAELQTTLARK